MRSGGEVAGWRSSAIGTVSVVGCRQSTGTVRVAHWKPSPQSAQVTAALNAGSGGQVVVVVVVVDGFGFAPLGRPGTEPAGSASAATTATARKMKVKRLT